MTELPNRKAETGQTASRRVVLAGLGSTAIGLLSDAVPVCGTPVPHPLRRRAPLVQIVRDSGHDATDELLTARRLRSPPGDAAVLERVCNEVSRHVVVRPELGSLVLNRRVRLKRSGQYLGFLGGRGQVPITHGDANRESGISVGNPADGAEPANGFVLENAWFLKEGRLGYTGKSALPNRLAAGQAHLEVFRGQAFLLRGCGGFGLPHLVKLVGCGGGMIEDAFFYGGVWNLAEPEAQESISQIYCADGAPYRLSHNVNITIRDAEAYGGNSRGVVERKIGQRTVHAREHCGPRFGVLAESVECLTIEGGFFAGYAEAAIASRASSPSCVLMRIVLRGTFLDESNSALVKTFRDDDRFPALDTLIVNGCDMNGQLVAENGLRLQASPGGLASVMRVLRTASPVRAVLGAGARLEGFDQYDESMSNAYGYNLADNEDGAVPGLFTSGIYVGPRGGRAIITNEQFGGGMNGLDDEGNSVDPATGLTPNGCLWGVYAANRSTFQALLRSRNLAKRGGALLGGRVTRMDPEPALEPAAGGAEK